MGVSPAALYEKLNHIEPETSSALIRQTAADAAGVIDAMPAAKKEILPGLEVFYLDGNHLAATEHRLAELRVTREGPLPGQSLALLDAQRELIVDLCRARTATPRSGRCCRSCWSGSGAGIVVVADRNFCTSGFLFGLAAREAFFVIRQHGSTLTSKLRGQRRRVGRIATGMVYEQGMELHFEGGTLSVRRITLVPGPPDRERRHRDPHPDQPVGRAGDGAAGGPGVRDALDGGGGVPDADRRAPLRGRDAGLSARGAVLVRDGRAGLQHVRRGEGVVARRTGPK